LSHCLHLNTISKDERLIRAKQALKQTSNIWKLIDKLRKDKNYTMSTTTNKYTNRNTKTSHRQKILAGASAWTTRSIHEHHPSDSRPPETIPTSQDQEKRPMTYTRRNRKRRTLAHACHAPTTGAPHGRGWRWKDRRATANSTKRCVSQKARRMGTDLATKTEMTVKLG
jgi:hypothetical protein